jgi:hypothetical protein
MLPLRFTSKTALSSCSDLSRKLLPHELTERVHDLRNEVTGYKKKVKLRKFKPIEEKIEEGV